MAAKIGVVIHTNLREQLFSEEDRTRLESLGDVVWTDSAEKLSTEKAIDLLKDADVGVGSWGTPKPDQALMDGCPCLRLWEHVAGTVKMMFGPHLDGRDMTIASCKGAIADNVAEVTVGEIITGVRRVWENAAEQRRVYSPDGGAQVGERKKYPQRRVMSVSTIGIVAASEIGRRVSKLLQPFGCRVLCYDPYLTREQAAAFGAELVDDLVELCRLCDAVTLHTPALPATKHMLGAKHFQAMGDDTVFVNTSRGNCIDQAALVEELQKGRLFAFLDVTDPEPTPLDSPLRALPNVVLTPHLAGARSFNLGRRAVDDIQAFLQGGSPQCVVTKDMLGRVA
jgi:phosphoglycerate dehydrogenase-like enzyme